MVKSFFTKKLLFLLFFHAFAFLFVIYPAFAVTLNTFQTFYYYPDNINVRNITGYEYSYQGYKVEFLARLQDSVNLNNTIVVVTATCPQGTYNYPLSFANQTYAYGVYYAWYSGSMIMPNSSVMQGLCTLSLNATVSANNSLYNNLNSYPNSNDILANINSPPYLNISAAPQLNFYGAQKGRWNNATPYPVVFSINSSKDREGEGILLDFNLLIPHLEGNVAGEIVTADNFRFYTSLNSTPTYQYYDDNFMNLVEEKIPSVNYTKNLYIQLYLAPTLQSTSFTGGGLIYNIEDISMNQPAFVNYAIVQPYNSTHLFCNASASDIDGDATSLTYNFYLNRSGVVHKYSSSILPYVPTYQFQLNDKIICEAKPYSKNKYGIFLNSSPYNYNGIPGDELQVVYYEDAGNPNLEQHLVQGADFTGWGNSPEYSVAAHGSKVIFSFPNMSNYADYYAEVTYFGAYNGVTHRMQSLDADGIILHSAMLIPETSPQTYTYLIPKEAQQDGIVNLSFNLVQGDNAVVSLVRILVNTSSQPKPAKITIINPINNTEVDGSLEKIELAISTDVYATCQYSTSPFTYGNGTQFTLTGGLIHKVNVTLQSVNDYYYICKTTNNIIGEMVYHHFTKSSSVFYDDCGNNAAEPHLVQGYDSTAWGSLPEYSVSTHPSRVIYSYNVNPTARYKVNVTYFRPNVIGEERVQRLLANGNVVHDAMQLPTTPTRYSFNIPQGSYANGILNLTFELVSGNSAVVSEIWLYEVPKNDALIDNFEDGIEWLSSSQARTISLSQFSVNGSSMRVNYTTGAEDYAYVYKTFSEKDLSKYNTLELDVYLNYSGSGNPKIGVIFNNGTSNLNPVNWEQYPSKNEWNHLYVNISNLQQGASSLRIYVYKNKDNMTSGKEIEYYFDNIILSNNTKPIPVDNLPVVESFDDISDWQSAKRVFEKSSFGKGTSTSLKTTYTTGTEDYGFLLKSFPSQDWSQYNTLEFDIYLNYSSTGNPKIGILLGNGTVQYVPINAYQYPKRGEWNHYYINISNINRKQIDKIYVYLYKNKDNMPSGQEITYYIDNFILSNNTLVVSNLPLIDDFEDGLKFTSSSRNLSITNFAVNGKSMKISYTTGTEDYGFAQKDIPQADYDWRAYNTLELDVYLNYSGSGNPKLGIVLDNGTASLFPVNWAQYPAKNQWQHLKINISNLDLKTIKKLRIYAYKNKDNMPSGNAIDYYIDNIKLTNVQPSESKVLVDDFENIDWTSAKRTISSSDFAVNGSSMAVSYTTGAEDYAYLLKSFSPRDYSAYSTLEFDVYLNYSGSGNPKLGVLLGRGSTQLYPVTWQQYPRPNRWVRAYVNVSNLDLTNIDKIYLYVYKNKDNMPSGNQITYYFDNMYFSNNIPVYLNPVVEDFDDVSDWQSSKRTFSTDPFAINGSSMRISYTTGAEDYAFVSKTLATEQDWSNFDYLDINVYLNYSSTGSPKFGIVLVDSSNNQLFPANWAQYPARNQWNSLRFDISNIDRRHIKKVNIYVYKNKDNMPSGQEITYYLDNMVLS